MSEPVNYRKKDGPQKETFLLPDFMSEISGIANALTEHRYQMGFLQIVRLSDCINYYKEEAGKLQGDAAAGFILSVRRNLDPRNENDNYIVVQGLVNRRNEPIAVNGESISRIMHTRTIDDDLIKALNGQETMIFSL